MGSIGGGFTLVTRKRPWDSASGLVTFKMSTIRARRGEEVQLWLSCRPAPPEDCMLGNEDLLCWLDLVRPGKLKSRGAHRHKKLGLSSQQGEKRGLVEKPGLTALKEKRGDTAEASQKCPWYTGNGPEPVCIIEVVSCTGFVLFFFFLLSF